MMRFLLYVLLAWFLYQFIFKLVIPVYRASRKIKHGFREMQDKMNEQYRQQNPPQPEEKPKAKTGDYIDFEEVK